MENYYLPEINPTGEKYVEIWLAENGYVGITKEQLKSNNYGIVAKGKNESLLIQVRTFLHPQRPYKLSDFEINSISGKAAKLLLVAYAAYVTIDEGDNLVGEIIWERLS